MQFSEVKKQQYLAATDQRMDQAKSGFINACQTIQDVNANWQAYKLVDSQDNVEANSLEFSDAAKAMTAEVVPVLAQALDIIAGGSLSVDGDINSPRLTRQDLLDQLANYGA